MSWGIVADSSCNLRHYQPVTPGLQFRIAPLKVNVDGTEYIDDENLDVSELNKAVASSSQGSNSSCPNAGEWANLLRCADNVIAITISANLSASHEAAVMAREIVCSENPDANILVINSRAAGGKLELLVQRIDEFISSGTCSFADVCAFAESLEQRSTVLFSLSHYDNLVKAGRMPRLAGSLASRMNIRMLGIASDEGTIQVVGPTRGDRKTYAKIVSKMEQEGFDGGLVYIDHVENEKGAQALSELIRATWNTAEIHVLPCGGLCSYYAESEGIIIGFGWPEGAK